MDFKCQNGDEEWVFDQVSEAGREQTHCHTYQRLDCFHGYKKVTGIKSKKNSSSEKIPDVRSYSGKKGWVWIDWLDVKEAIFCILKCETLKHATDRQDDNLVRLEEFSSPGSTRWG